MSSNLSYIIWFVLFPVTVAGISSAALMCSMPIVLHIYPHIRYQQHKLHNSIDYCSLQLHGDSVIGYLCGCSPHQIKHLNNYCLICRAGRRACGLIMARLDRNSEPYSLLSPDRQSNGPSGGSNHITVFTEANVMQVKHNSEHSAVENYLNVLICPLYLAKNALKMEMRF